MSADVSGPGECIFCRIVAREVPSTEVYSGPLAYAFEDLGPQAPLHVLIVPREHIADAAQIGPEHGPVLVEMLAAAQKVASAKGLDGSGYRLVFNVGPDAGMTVGHLHLHVLAGRTLAWPPG